MDSRRLLRPPATRAVALALTLALAAEALAACGHLRLAGPVPPPADAQPQAAPASPAAAEREPAAPPRPWGTMAPIADPPPAASAAAAPPRAGPPSGGAGRAAIAAANTAARSRSRADRFLGGVQRFAYAPGRIYEVWAAPLRVTMLTLGPGETLVAKAAGDTVRWQIGETASGAGAARRIHVLLKPLRSGLETNLLLATSARVLMVELRSGAADAFNAEVTWDALDAGAPSGRDAGAEAPAPGGPEPPGAEPAAHPASAAAAPPPVDARYRITFRGPRPPWTPSAVLTDGRRTYVVFPPGLRASGAPALFVLGPGGAAQVVNYRQRGEVFIVDQVLDRAELRLGARRPRIVRLERAGAE